MYIEERLENIEKSLEEIKNILLHKVIPIDEVVKNAPKEEIKPEAKEKQPKKSKERVSKPLDESQISNKLLEGQNLVQGFILEPPRSQKIEVDGQVKPKWAFIMDDKKYGTFDEKMFQTICAVLDIQSKRQQDNPDAKILVNIVYTERIKGDKVLNDIVEFSQVTMDKVKP